MMWKKVISMLLVAAMLAMPIGCGKDGNKDKDTTSGVETTDIGDDSAETDAPPKTPVPKPANKKSSVFLKKISKIRFDILCITFKPPEMPALKVVI